MLVIRPLAVKNLPRMNKRDTKMEELKNLQLEMTYSESWHIQKIQEIWYEMLIHCKRSIDPRDFIRKNRRAVLQSVVMTLGQFIMRCDGGAAIVYVFRLSEGEINVHWLLWNNLDDCFRLCRISPRWGCRIDGAWAVGIQGVYFLTKITVGLNFPQFRFRFNFEYHKWFPATILRIWLVSAEL